MIRTPPSSGMASTPVGWRWLPYALSRVPLLLGWWLRQRKALRATERRDVLGIAVYVTRAPGVPLEAVVERVAAVLQLIRALGPRRFDRLQRDVPRLLILRGGGARFHVLTQTCVLDSERVLAHSAGSVALSLVHEATHARLYRMGVMGRGPQWKLRAERCCVRQELAFLEKLTAAGWVNTEAMREQLERIFAATATDASESCTQAV